MKTIIKKRIVYMKPHSLETWCDRCHRVFRKEKYWLIYSTHRTGVISKRRICQNCIKSDEIKKSCKFQILRN